MCLFSGLLNALVTIVHVQGTITEILLTLETLTPRTNASVHARFAGRSEADTGATRGRDVSQVFSGNCLAESGACCCLSGSGGITAAAPATRTEITVI